MQSSSAARGKLVIAHPERKAQRTLHRLVGACRWPVEIVADLEALAAAVDADTIAIVDAALARTRPQLRTAPARAWIAVPGDGSSAADPDTVDALLEAGWTHVASHPMPILAEELLTTVLKVIRGDAFGLEKYLMWGAEVRSYTLADTRDRDTAVAELAKEVIASGLPERAGSLASVIADELLTNALYAAPVDEAGQRFRAQEARDQSRALTGREAVTVRWATDARYLAIEVRDSWGSIDDTMIATRLASGAKRAPQTDGGMGLPLVYACCTQLVVGTAPAARTEVIALLDVRYRPTELGRAASFHTFRGTVEEE
ncbi:MAG TPA: hypothetical protein VNO30_05335 [Kofleriaceae bacterium]|nr:hypothetical protein [Kofleriaceae bacterium]